MNLSVTDENIHKVVKDMRVLIKECLIPRIDELEEETRVLRELIWPVCSAILEDTRCCLKDTDRIELLAYKKLQIISRLFPNETWRWCGKLDYEYKKIYDIINNGNNKFRSK